MKQTNILHVPPFISTSPFLSKKRERKFIFFDLLFCQSLCFFQALISSNPLGNVLVYCVICKMHVFTLDWDSNFAANSNIVVWRIVLLCFSLLWQKSPSGCSSHQSALSVSVCLVRDSILSYRSSNWTLLSRLTWRQGDGPGMEVTEFGCTSALTEALVRDLGEGWVLFWLWFLNGNEL